MRCFKKILKINSSFQPINSNLLILAKIKILILVILATNFYFITFLVIETEWPICSPHNIVFRRYAMIYQ